MSVAFDNIINFRDVGKTVNDYLGRRLLQESVLYRSARPDDASPADRKKLKEELGVKTIVDLRSKTEHIKQAQKRQADRSKTPAVLQTNAAFAEPVQIPGLRYREVQVTGRRFERFLLSQLSWWNYFKLIFLFILGYRMQAVSLLGREVMQPLGLVGLSLSTMDASGPEIVEALRTLTTPSSPPVLVHCTQGKDRTGLIIALALMTLGVPTDAIAHDYLLSQEGLKVEQESRLVEIREIGLSAEWASTPPDFVERLEDHLRTKYGGINGFLSSVEFGDDERKRLVEVLGA
ncbi:tyrosine/serine protein phosphatase [Hypoxylon trugodes]|uniref:tyrosine/serine protein phosphatase n=1 Tax=Hypoxylon trugodes TaxID=326681 RepID=UPI002194DF38|nr:tyrosine/serine protein phosphatase [Hypoxylon trugodes]KAI1391178.1 tyrosine/serine protein phosphatase [Hypoxylon trugodes]